MGDIMAVCGIYKITNQITHKCYIGQSKDIFRRWREHLAKGYKDIDWHTNLQLSPENYTFEIVTQCDEEDLNDLESYYIHIYDSINEGYNKKKVVGDLFQNQLNDTNIAKSLKQEDKIISETLPISEKDFTENYIYSIEDILKLTNRSKQAIYGYMKKYSDFFHKNSITLHRKKWYNQLALNALITYYNKSGR